MSKFHALVYRLSGLHEVDVVAESPQAAMAIALQQAKREDAVWQTSDNEYIVFPFDLDQPECEDVKMITADSRVIDTLTSLIPSVPLSPALQQIFGVCGPVTGKQFVALVRSFGIILTVQYDEEYLELVAAEE